MRPNGLVGAGADSMFVEVSRAGSGPGEGTEPAGMSGVTISPVRGVDSKGVPCSGGVGLPVCTGGDGEREVLSMILRLLVGRDLGERFHSEDSVVELICTFGLVH